jgi:serine/threonine protein kinase
MKVEKLKVEALILSFCKHANIVEYIDSFEENGVFYLVMKYIDGETLTTVCRKKKPDYRTIIEWSKQILSALSYLHGLGIIYRDLKPGNVMIRKDNTAILIDFGGARKGRTETTIRTTGSIFTPTYAAPEQIVENRTDVRSDIYSMGATMYYMLTCSEPPRPRSIDGIPSPRINDPGIDIDIEKIVLTAGHSDPAFRYQSVKSMMDALEDISKKFEVKKACLILINEAGRETFKEYPIVKEQTIISRESLDPKYKKYMDIYVRDKYVSLHPKDSKSKLGHAIITKDEHGNYWISDLQSTNGTFVNDRRIYSKTRLHDRDKIKLGPLTTFQFRLE